MSSRCRVRPSQADLREQSIFDEAEQSYRSQITTLEGELARQKVRCVYHLLAFS